MTLSIHSIQTIAATPISTADIEQWATELNRPHQRLAPCCKQVETKQHNQEYLQG
ncbi:MAG: hypothetical protein ACP5RH_16060 [Leptodesmis sp.]|uniref:hypothetical protein n=1 Tax=Leptodesmis sp. TaxID=3100501 RepID=UPI003D09A6C8